MPFREFDVNPLRHPRLIIISQLSNAGFQRIRDEPTTLRQGLRLTDVQRTLLTALRHPLALDARW